MSVPGGWQDDADAMIDRVNGQVEAAQQRAAAARAMRTQMDELRGQARSRNGEVTVVVNLQGRLMDLQLTDAAYELTPRELAALTLELVAQAHRSSTAEAIDLAGRTFGESSSSVAALSRELKSFDERRG
jgi:DNA-binding protein YbaB